VAVTTLSSVTEGSDAPQYRHRRAFDAPQQPAARTRAIVVDGVRWHVREIEAAERPWSRGERYLIFVSSGMIRQVREYPADWWQLPADELYAVGGRP